jgi:very-short-patch-repair endonuclease
MSGTILLLFAIAAAFLAATKLGWLSKRGAGQGAQHWPVFPKKVLTPVEQQLYQRLVRAFPEHVVLAQVSLSQLVGVKKGHDFKANWNRYNRLTADFVLCNKDFSIAAVLELDDRSHDSPQRMDADRRKAAVLNAAGIALHRLNVNPLPNESDLRALLDLAPMPASAPPGARVVPLHGRPR